MAEELSIDGLKGMKKAEFVKAFKNKPQWKKAKAVILFVDYKLEGKKTTVAIPFKKVAEMKLEVKRIKKEKLHPMKKSVGGIFSLENEGEDGIKAKIEITHGGVKPEILQAKAEDLFGRINAQLEVLIAADAELENEEELDKDHDDKEDNNTPASEIENAIKEIAALIREKVTQIIADIKDKKAEEEYFDIIENVSEKISDLKESFENAADDVKAKLKSQVDQLLAYIPRLVEIKKALEIILKKGEAPNLPDNVKKIIEILVAKIKEAKAAKKDPKKFKAIVKLIKKSFEALTLALGLIKKELAEKIKQSKVYQFIEDFIDTLNEEVEDEDYEEEEEETEEENVDETEENDEPKITEEEKKEFESTIKELETLFSAVGIKF
jgi:hypothetical protein